MLGTPNFPDLSIPTRAKPLAFEQPQIVARCRASQTTPENLSERLRRLPGSAHRKAQCYDPPGLQRKERRQPTAHTDKPEDIKRNRKGSRVV